MDVLSFIAGKIAEERAAMPPPPGEQPPKESPYPYTPSSKMITRYYTW